MKFKPGDVHYGPDTRLPDVQEALHPQILQALSSRIVDLRETADHLRARTMVLADRLFGSAPSPCADGCNGISKDPAEIDILFVTVDQLNCRLRDINEQLMRLEAL